MKVKSINAVLSQLPQWDCGRFVLAPDDDAEADSLFTIELDVVTDADGAISISAPRCSIIIWRRW